MMSLLKTKKSPEGLSFLRMSSANLRGPAVPSATSSWEYVILILYFFSSGYSEFLM